MVYGAFLLICFLKTTHHPIFDAIKKVFLQHHKCLDNQQQKKNLYIKMNDFHFNGT